MGRFMKLRGDNDRQLTLEWSRLIFFTEALIQEIILQIGISWAHLSRTFILHLKHERNEGDLTLQTWKKHVVAVKI